MDDVRPDDAPGTDAWREAQAELAWEQYLEACIIEDATRPLHPVIPDELAEDEDDLGVCPYYARYESLPGHDPRATCAFGCWDEPQCVTCVPRDGWPSVRRWIEAQEAADAS